MTLPQSAVSDLLDALRAGVDLVRESVRIVLQELIEAEATRPSAPPATNGHRPGRRNATAPAPSC